MKYNNMEQFTPETIVELYKKGKPIVDIAHGLNIRGREVIAILSRHGINVHQVEMTYGEKNSLDPDNFRLIQIDTPRFSVRTANCLKKIGVFTVEDLLNCTESDLCNIKGFGKLSLSEVDQFVSELKNGFSKANGSNLMGKESDAADTKSLRYDDRSASALKKAYFYQYRDRIFNGDFSFAEEDGFPEQYADKVKIYEDGYKLLDGDILEQCKNNPQSVALIIGCLLDFSKRQKRKEEIYEVIDRIPSSRKNSLAKYYIVAYTDDKETQDMKFFGGQVFSLPIESALERGFLVPYYYYPIYVNATDSEVAQFRSFNQKILSCFKNGRCINPDLLVKSLRGRLRVISMSSEKMENIDRIVDQIDEKDHIVVYCGDGKLFDNQTGAELRHIQAIKKVLAQHEYKASQFTATESMDDRMELVDAFNKGEITALAAIRCLDEGINIPSIKSALILSSNDDYREFVQRRGRILRLYKNKQYAKIYDVIVLPPNDMSTWAKIELRRYREYAHLALNWNELQDDLNGRLMEYGLTEEDVNAYDYEDMEVDVDE